ncbi:PAS domain S-box protein [Schnuerera sp. xch1]|uniref:MASE3 domain-containing sensor histidine kinase n=1 Tax=Schnuerera sp. xch1 TaxID=2874283 RepID=UPI001CBF5576|nr:MASE3 domain-containing protein [Schnuerera sp. xch1]MBZ2174408.1 PAS domain S-box protein [Schnuerera sp. xch1]
MDHIKYQVSDCESNNVVKYIFIYMLVLISVLFLAYNNFLVYHTAIELLSTLIVLLTATIALIAYNISENDSMIFLGIAYGFIGCLDLIHILTYMDIGVFESNTTNISTQLWIIARYLESISLLTSFMLVNKKISLKKVFLNYFGISALLLISILYFNIFPDCFVKGVGLTSFRKISEYIICGILLLGISYFINSKDTDLNKTDIFLVLSVTTTIISEAFFIHYIEIYNLTNILGHALKLISFYLIYTALVESGFQQPSLSVAKINNILCNKNQNLERIIHRYKSQSEKEKRSEIESLRKTELLTGILESSLDGILVVDNDKDIMHVNKQFARMMNISYKEVSSKNFNQVITHIRKNLYNPEDFKRCIKDFQKSKGNQTYYFKFKNEKLFEVSVLPFIDKGVKKGNIINCRDITQREKVEELQKKIDIRQALLQKAKEIDDMKNSFFRTVSHELRTPLNVILGIIQLLPNINKNDAEEQNVVPDEYLKILTQNCYRLIKIADNLIDITKIDSGHMHLNLKNHNIVSIIEDITLSVAEYVKDKDISLIFDTEVEERIIACDDYELQRVMLNLLSNSIKFKESNQEIKVNIRNKDDKVVISVKDNGKGIPENMINTIFDRFEQVDSSLHRNNEGSGIGLSIVKSIIEMHGGKIFLNSQLGKGSEFIIELPVYLVDDDENSTKVNRSKDVIIDRVGIEFSDIYEISS